jgi:hypothetical protein
MDKIASNPIRRVMITMALENKLTMGRRRTVCGPLRSYLLWMDSTSWVKDDVDDGDDEETRAVGATLLASFDE